MHYCKRQAHGFSYNPCMDNFSHALSGLVAAELVHRSLPHENEVQSQTRRRRLLLATGILAASFPDLDLVLTPLLPEPLGYLLHHRGHTHTFLYAIPQALLIAALLLLPWPAARRLLAQSRAARAGFCLTLVAGLALHIGMDYLNSYGVHPFHPLDSRWFYGDMIFIIEPVFWVALGTPLFISLKRKWIGWALIAVILAVTGYFTNAGFMDERSFVFLAGLAAVLVVVHYSTDPRGIGGLLAGCAACLIFIGVQAVASAAGYRMVEDMLKARTSGTTVLDIAMTPYPANPVCWNFASIEYAGDEYQVSRGVLSVMPDTLPAAACPSSFAQVPGGLRDDYNAATVLTTHRGELASLHALYDEDCFFRAWTRFARIPVHEQSRAWDLRFARNGDNFTLIDLDRMSRHECPARQPQWDRPRKDLLEEIRNPATQE